MAELGEIYGLRRDLANEVGAGGGGPSFGGIVPVLGVTVPVVKSVASNTARDILLRAIMQKQMDEAQGISDAVRRPQIPQWSPQDLPEWPVNRPWPGSPRNTRVA